MVELDCVSKVTVTSFVYTPPIGLNSIATESVCAQVVIKLKINDIENNSFTHQK